MRHPKTGGVHAYRRDGRTFYRVAIRYRDFDGRLQRYRESGFPNRLQAETAIAKKRAAALQPPRAIGSELTVEQAWEVYKPISERDNDSYASDRGRAAHLLRHLSQTQVMKLNLGVIDGYRTKRFTELIRRRDGQGKLVERSPSPAQLDREVELLKRFLNYCVDAGCLEFNPIGKVKLLNRPNTRSVVVTEDKFQVVLSKVRDNIRPILLIAYDHGMRKREVLDLRWDQVNLKEGKLTLLAEDTKTQEARDVFLTGRALASLKVLPKGEGAEPVFPNPETGKAWVDIRKSTAAAFLAAGLHGVWFHDTRRSGVTNARKRGVPESVVMKMSGHKTRSVFDRYNIVDDADLKEAVRKIEVGQAPLGHESAPPKATNS